MKNLESKYIDLANFYKKEMLDKSDSSKYKRPQHMKNKGSDYNENVESDII